VVICRIVPRAARPNGAQSRRTRCPIVILRERARLGDRALLLLLGERHRDFDDHIFLAANDFASAQFD
jgi:hypothetical protein